MAETPYSKILLDGLWHNNTGLVALLGLCPLLAVSNTAVNGLGLGLATLLTLLITNSLVAAIRDLVRPEVRIPIYVLLIASVVTAIGLLMNAWFHTLYTILGIFIPLIVTNCAIIGRAEAFAARNTVARSAVDALAVGLGFAAVLMVLGGLRELLADGTLFAHADLLFGPAGKLLSVHLFDSSYQGFLLAALPPGAFIGLGLLIALKNVIDGRLAKRSERRRVTAPAVATPT